MSFFNTIKYFYHDSDKSRFSPQPSVDIAVAKELNAQGFSVCFMPNPSVDRTNNGVKKILAWFVDIDFKDTVKPELDDILSMSPLIPTYVVDTRNGFHIYFLARGADVATYRQIQKRLIQYFSGDEKCVNEARLMRAPNYYHMKDLNNPYLVEVVFETEAKYSIGQMLNAFPPHEDELIEDEPKAPTSVDVNNADNIFDKIRHFDSRMILQRLSGTKYVGFKSYRFKRTAKHHYNIIVDGKDSGCFINEIGNVMGSEGYRGGAIEWLTWYGLNRVDALNAVKDVMGWD